MPWELGVPGAAEGPPAPFPPAPAVPPPLELSLLFWPVESCKRFRGETLRRRIMLDSCCSTCLHGTSSYREHHRTLALLANLLYSLLTAHFQIGTPLKGFARAFFTRKPGALMILHSQNFTLFPHSSVEVLCASALFDFHFWPEVPRRRRTLSQHFLDRSRLRTTTWTVSLLLGWVTTSRLSRIDRRSRRRRRRGDGPEHRTNPGRAWAETHGNR